MDVAAVEARVRDCISAELPRLAASPVVLAASGGADSMALVALLCERDLIDRGRTVIAHFNHALRSNEEAALDRQSVDALASRYRLNLRSETWDEPRSGEDAARRARYAFLQRAALDHGAAAIVTGHTADDQAETVLMHAMRGAGLHGLSGMRVDSPLEGSVALRIWRPLLGVARSETREYCEAHGLTFVDDASNDDRRLLRNRVRHDLLPRLSETADAREAMLGVAAYAHAAASSLDAVATTALEDGADARTGAVLLSRTALGALPQDAVPHAFRLAIVRLLGDARDIERKHYEIMEHALHARTGARFALPRGVTLMVDASCIILTSCRPGADRIDDAIERQLPFIGRSGAWDLRVMCASEARLADGGIDLRLPEGAIVRGRRPGDRVRTRAGSKKLGDWYIDRKIPRRDRDAAPVIAYGNQVFWTPWGAYAEMPGAIAWRISALRAHASAQRGALDAVESVPV